MERLAWQPQHVPKVVKQNLSSQTKTKDRQLSKTHALVLDAVGPLAFILESAVQGTLTHASAVEAAQTALKLLENASGLLAMERRRNALSDMNPNLKDIAEEDSLYKEAAPNHFGDGFSKKAKERDDELKVLRSTIKQAPKKTSFNNWKGKDHGSLHGISGPGSSLPRSHLLKWDHYSVHYTSLPTL